MGDLLARCTFPDPGAPLAAAFSGGADSTALVVLAREHGCLVTAHHVDHGIRPESAGDAAQAAAIAERLDVPFVVHRTTVPPGPNLEARARQARRELLPAGIATGHTADDLAETVILRLLRGTGPSGIAAMRPGPRHPLLALRRDETIAVCAAAGIAPVIDESNDDRRFRRNRVRHDLLPAMLAAADRDVVPLLCRHAGLVADDEALLESLADGLDPTDARALAAAPAPLARRAIRRWLSVAGYPPDAAAVDRVLGLAHGVGVACEIVGNRRVERSRQRLRIVEPER